jgi:DNA-binding LytR/AlgR family response regulator
VKNPVFMLLLYREIPDTMRLWTGLLGAGIRRFCPNSIPLRKIPVKIAICDDEIKDAELIRSYCQRYNPEYSVTIFTSGKALLEAYPEEKYSLIFMDIQLHETEDGLTIGERLANTRRPPLIILTTISNEYLGQGYGIAFRYLFKPISYECFEENIQLAEKRLRPERMEIFVNAKSMNIAVDDILYAESVRNSVIFHLLGGQTVQARGPFSQYVKDMVLGDFCQCHRSYCVNMRYISNIVSDGIRLKNGDTIPLGRSKKPELMERLKDVIKTNSPL